MLTPELYRCAVAIAGVSDLPESLRNDRSESGRSSMTYQYWLRSMGNPQQNRAGLIAVSPARQAASIHAPVLLIHGEDDENVPIRQSELMEEALQEAGRDVRFVRIPDSGHIWSNWSAENRLTLLRETEAFLAQHLQ
jgi:dipeptidyl aminopeptidase/acylaminoacyl peptidase